MTAEEYKRVYCLNADGVICSLGSFGEPWETSEPPRAAGEALATHQLPI